MYSCVLRHNSEPHMVKIAIMKSDAPKWPIQNQLVAENAWPFRQTLITRPACVNTFLRHGQNGNKDRQTETKKNKINKTNRQTSAYFHEWNTAERKIYRTKIILYIYSNFAVGDEKIVLKFNRGQTSASRFWFDLSTCLPTFRRANGWVTTNNKNILWKQKKKTTKLRWWCCSLRLSIKQNKSVSQNITKNDRTEAKKVLWLLPVLGYAMNRLLQPQHRQLRTVRRWQLAVSGVLRLAGHWLINIKQHQPSVVLHIIFHVRCFSAILHRRKSHSTAACLVSCVVFMA